MPIPENRLEPNDVVSIMIDACGEKVRVKQSDGSFKDEIQLNNHRVWLKTHNINSNRFARYQFFRERLESLARTAKDHMTFQKAQVLYEQIMNLCSDYDYSIDAKSSEAISDKHNGSATLIDKINRKETTRRYVLSDELKKSGWESFIGPQASRDDQKER